MLSQGYRIMIANVSQGIPQCDARDEEAPLLARSGAVLRPRRWECGGRESLQGVCGSAVQLSDRRDRVLLLVLSVLRRALIQQMGDPQSCGGCPYFVPGAEPPVSSVTVTVAGQHRFVDQ